MTARIASLGSAPLAFGQALGVVPFERVVDFLLGFFMATLLFSAKEDLPSGDTQKRPMRDS
jgi:hypothetical protein